MASIDADRRQGGANTYIAFPDATPNMVFQATA